MTIYLPTEIRENISVINRVPWGWGRLPLTHWLSDMKNRFIKIQDAKDLFTHLQPTDHVCTLYMTRRKRDWRKELDELKSRALRKNQNSLEKTIEAWLQTLESSGTEEYEFYLAVQLDTKMNLLAMTANLLDVEAERIWPFAGELLTDEKVQELSEKFLEWTGKFGIEPLAAHEIAEFYRDHNYLGMRKPPLEETLFSSGRWKTPDTTWLMPNPIEVHDKFVRIDGEWDTRYVSFVSVALFPQKILVPGFDLFYEVQTWGLPVEGMIRWKQRDPKMTRFFANRKYRAAKSNNEHIREIGQTLLADEETEAKAELFHREVTKSSTPMNVARIVFKVSASTPNELNSACEYLINQLENKGVIAERNRGDQDLLYDQWLPVNRWRVVGYKQELLPTRTAAIVMPGITDVCGDPDGLPMGRIVQNHRPFRLFLPYGALNDRASVMVINGPLGSGKTHLANQVAIYTAKMLPSRVIIEDPKAEKESGEIEAYFKEMDIDVRVIELSGSKYPGVLDPFGIVRNLEKAKQKAISMIQQATSLYDAKSEDIITEAVDRVGARAIEPGYKPSMGKVIEELLNDPSDKAKRIGRWLERAGRLQLGQLIFGDRSAPGAEAFELPETGVIFLKIAGLNLPGRGEDARDIEQRMSLAVNYGKNILIHEFLLEGKEKGVFSVFVNDESWKDFQNPYSGKETKTIARLGRSNFCGVIFCTQHPSDIPDEIWNLCSTYVCLGVEHRKEAYRAMQQLRIDPEEEDIADELESLGAKQSEESQRKKERTSSFGFVRDLFGRTAFVEFLTPEREMKDFLKSRPEHYQEEGEDNVESSNYIEVV